MNKILKLSRRTGVVFDGLCPCISCPETGPHSHPICPKCGAVKFGNANCEECRSYWKRFEVKVISIRPRHFWHIRRGQRLVRCLKDLEGGITQLVVRVIEVEIYTKKCEYNHRGSWWPMDFDRDTGISLLDEDYGWLEEPEGDKDGTED